MKTFSIILLLILGISAHAQQTDRSEYRVDIGNDVFFGGLENVRFNTNTSAYGIKGTRFLFDNFLDADVYFSNKTLALDKKLNYDCYMDQVVYSDGKDMYVLKSFYIDLIQFHPKKDSSVFFERVLLPENKDIVFMQVLYDGVRILYKQYIKKLVLNDDQPSYNWDEKYANEYIIRTEYYLMEPGSKDLIPLPPSKNKFLRSAGEYREELKKYMKKENINYKKENDLTRLLEYYDEIEYGNKEF